MDNSTTIVDFSKSTKNAALYFDYVVPFTSFGIRYNDPEIWQEAKKADPDELHSSTYATAHSLKASLEFRIADSILPPYMRQPGDELELLWLNNDAVEYGLNDQFYKEVDRFFRKWPQLEGAQWLWNDEVPTNPNAPEELLLTITELQLVDANQANWDQILEFRQDSEAKSAFKRFRLFALQNYTGKSKNFIEDHIALQIEDYHRQAKKHGLISTAGRLKILAAPPLIGSLGSFVAWIFGLQDLTMLMESAAAGGLISSIIGLGCEVAIKKHAMSELREMHPISYIIQAKSHLMP